MAERIESVDEATLAWSEYHRQPKVLDEEREDHDEEDQPDPDATLKVVLIGGQ